jgi:hypothetical protein
MKSVFARIFVPQAVLDEWSVGEHILLNGDEVTLSPSEWRYRLTPAVHVGTCASGHDTRGIVGKICRDEDLKKGGAEVYLGSLVWGEDAYEGTPGFLAVRVDSGVPRAFRSGPGGAKGPREEKDVEMLTKLVLENM